MQYTEQQKEEFRQEFAKRRRRQMMLVIPIIGLLALKIFFKTGGRSGPLYDFLSSDIPLVILMVFIIGALAFSLKNWRCPACNAYLGRGASPRFCPKCGVPFEKESA